MIDKQKIRQILDDNSNDSGDNCWEFTRAEIDKTIEDIYNLVSVPAETLDTTKIILMVSVNKTSKIDGKIFNKNCHYIGYDRDKLRKYLLTFYKIKNLIRDVGDEFPYFTDGGFRYTAENEYWKYEFICHPYNIID